MKPQTTALLILLALGAGTAIAAPEGYGGAFYQTAGKSSGTTLSQATEQVRRQTGGRVLSAETINKDGRKVHRIKVLTPNHKVVIREIDAGDR